MVVPTEDLGKAASGTVDALKSQPLALALVVVNVLFLLAGGYFLRDIAQHQSASEQRKDELLADMARRCLYATPPADSRGQQP
jgi:hypothetical protein